MRLERVVLFAAFLAACEGTPVHTEKPKPSGDTTPPVVSGLTATPARAGRGSTINVAFNVDEALKRLSVLVAGRSAECTEADGAYSCAFTLVGDESAGTQPVLVRAIDLAGNVGTAETTFEIDYAAPKLTFTSRPPPLSNSPQATVEFESDEGEATYLCSVDGQPATPCQSPFNTGTLAEGRHTIVVVGTDTFGNEETIKVEFTLDLTPPETLLVRGVPELTREEAHEIYFRSNDFSARFECRLDDAPFAACTSPHQLTGFAEGPHSFEIRAIDEVGNIDPSPVKFDFVADRTAPVVTLAPLPDTGSPDLSIEFAVDEVDSTAFCSLDGAPFGECSSPVSFTALADGDHSFDVYAVDQAGNKQAVPASLVFIVDTTPPSTSIYSGPPPYSSQTSAVLHFSANEAGATFVCSLDGTQNQPCTSPFTASSLTDGQHRLEVIATDKYGNVDATPAVSNWIVDTTPPVVSFTEPVPALVLQAQLTVAFAADEASSYTCSLDGAPFASCQSPLLIRDLTDNVNTGEPSHVFTVRATDRAGNVSEDLVATFDVNLAFPRPGLVKLIEPDPSRQANSTPTFAWSGPDCDSYDFVLSTDPTFNDASKVVVSLEDTVEDSFTPTTPLAVGKYHVRLRGKNITGYGDWAPGGAVEVTSGWRKITRQAVESTLRWVSCSTIDNCVFGGESGVLLHTLDGGKSFRQAASPVTNTIYATAWVDESTAIAVGTSGTILRSLNGGATWYQITRDASGSTLPTNEFRAVHFKGNVGMITGTSGIVFLSEDGGESWTRVTNAGTASLYGVAVLSTSPEITAVAINWDGNTYRTVDGGATWSTAVKLPGSAWGFSLSFIDENVGFASADKGLLFRTTDGGRTWSAPNPANANTGEYVQVVVAIDADTALLVQFASGTSTYSAVRKVQFGSPAVWTEATRTDTGAVRGLPTLYGLSMVGDEGFAVGASGAIFRVTNGPTGVTFEEPSAAGGLPATGSGDAKAIHFPTPSIGFVGGTSGLLLRTTDGGWNFTALDADPNYATETINAIHFLDENTGWVAGRTNSTLTSFIARTDDGGETWTRLTGPTSNREILDIKFLSPDVGFAVGGSGTAWRWDPDTQTFVDIGPVPSMTSDLTSVAVVNENLIFVGGKNINKIGRWDGTAWTIEAAPGSPRGSPYMEALWALDSETVIAASDVGSIFKRSAGGNWTSVFDAGTSVSNFDRLFFLDDLHGWVVGSNGYVMSTVDGGTTWKRDTSFPSTSTNHAVFAFSPTDVMVTSTSRGIWRNTSFVP